MLGGLLSLLSAATFAFSNVAARRGVISGTVFQALAITVPIGVPIFLVVAVASGFIGSIVQFSLVAFLNLSFAGICHFVWGRYCNYRAINAMGSNLVSPVQQSSLLVSLGLAVWLLDEVLTPLRILGILLVIFGPAVALPRRGQKVSSKSGFQPRLAEGYSFAVMASLGYGLSPLFVRAALQDTSPGISLTGGLISYAAATVVVGAILLSAGPRHDVLSLDRVSGKWFTISGVFVCVSQMLRYMALSVAPVTVVTPIQRTSGVFRVLFSWFVNRDHEVFGVRVLVGIAISLVGALALTLSTEFVITNVPLPDVVVGIAEWRWP